MTNNINIYAQLIDAIKANTRCVLATVINTENSTSGNVGNKAIISQNGEISGWIGGGCCQGVVKKLSSQILSDNQSVVIRICPEHEFVDSMRCYPSHCASEGTVDIFLEPIANTPSLLLYGQTPVAQSISKYAEDLCIYVDWRQQLDESINSCSISHPNIAVIATQGQGDLEALHDAVRENVEHILLVASQKKAASLIAKLQESGASKQAIESVTAPAGIDIGAVNSSEIALSVMAKVVSLRNTLNKQPAQGAIVQEAIVQETVTKPVELLKESASEKHAPASCCGGKK